MSKLRREAKEYIAQMAETIKSQKAEIERLRMILVWIAKEVTFSDDAYQLQKIAAEAVKGDPRL